MLGDIHFFKKYTDINKKCNFTITSLVCLLIEFHKSVFEPKVYTLSEIKG